MNRGFYLTLMMGPFNASPVPQLVIDALTERAGDVDRRQPGRLSAQVHAGQAIAACTRCWSPASSIRARA